MFVELGQVVGFFVEERSDQVEHLPPIADKFVIEMRSGWLNLVQHRLK